MANKKITELTQTTNVKNTDLLLIETANGTCSISYEDIQKHIKEAIQEYIEENIQNESYPFAENAAAHNCIFRGKDLTSIYTIDEICSRISNGTFKDLYIGDYFDITITTSYTENEKVRCILAGFDTYFNNGIIGINRHHAVIVTKNCFNKISIMHDSNYDGGFVGSKMWKTILPVYKNALQTALNNHILMHKTRLTNSTNKDIGTASGSDWYDTYLSLLSEIQVYGSNMPNSSYHDIGCDNLQLPLFAFDPSAKICGKNTTINGNGDNSRQNYWLKNINNANINNVIFSAVGNAGENLIMAATLAMGIRPIFCIG